jgi:hypothetical protein
VIATELNNALVITKRFRVLHKPHPNITKFSTNTISPLHLSTPPGVVPLPTGDFLGMLLAWFSLLPIYILVGSATLYRVSSEEIYIQ